MRLPAAMAALGAVACAALIVLQFLMLGAAGGVILGLAPAFALHAFVRRRLRGAAASSLVLVFYVAGWLVEARAGRELALAATMTAAAAFCAALLFVRWQAAADRAARSAPAES